MKLHHRSQNQLEKAENVSYLIFSCGEEAAYFQLKILSKIENDLPLFYT